MSIVEENQINRTKNEWNKIKAQTKEELHQQARLKSFQHYSQNIFIIHYSYIHLQINKFLLNFRHKPINYSEKKECMFCYNCVWLQLKLWSCTIKHSTIKYANAHKCYLHFIKGHVGQPTSTDHHHHTTTMEKPLHTCIAHSSRFVYIENRVDRIRKTYIICKMAITKS